MILKVVRAVDLQFYVENGLLVASIVNVVAGNPRNTVWHSGSLAPDASCLVSLLALGPRDIIIRADVAIVCMWCSTTLGEVRHNLFRLWALAMRRGGEVSVYARRACNVADIRVRLTCGARDVTS